MSRSQIGRIPTHDPATDTRTFVGRHEAARVMGLSVEQFDEWDSRGMFPFSSWGTRLTPTGRPRPAPKLFPLEDLLRVRAEVEARYEPYPDPERPGCCRVPLRSLRRQLEALIDADCLPLVQGRFWVLEDADKSHTAYVVLSPAHGPKTPLRRIILGLEGPQHRISHANGDALDCRRANLVVHTIEQQLYRTRKRGTVSGREYSSKYKGVSWDEPRGKWKAQIQKDGRNRFIGRYDEDVEAAEAYDRAAREAFGEYALLNFAEPPPGAVRSAAA